MKKQILLLVPMVLLTIGVFAQQLITPMNFVVNSPATVAGTYDYGYPTDWGPTTLVTTCGDLAWGYTAAGDSIACDPIVTDLTGKIAMISRGACNFSLKVYHAQAAGAVGAVIVNLNTNPLDELVNMLGGDSMTAVTIPSVFVGYGTGSQLAVAMAAGTSNACFFVPSIDNAIGLYNYAVPKDQAQTLESFEMTVFNNGNADETNVVALIDITDPNNIDTDGTIKGFGVNSQDVLLPAFMAAYSGKNPDKVNTGLFRNIPLPNWTLRYGGLMNFKLFKKNFSNFVISHGYRSSYTVSSFTNNLQYNQDNPFATTNVNSGNYESKLLVSAVTLVDEFSPLVKVDMKMKNSFSLRGEVKRDRTLTMNFNNSTLTDIKGTEYIFGFGYVFKDVKMNTRFTGKKQTLRGDINLRADVSLRDNITQIRSVDEDNNQISGGQKLFSIKFTADYRLSSNLTASFYYNHQTSKYAISTTFPRQAINGGFNIVYNLGGN